MKLLLDHNLSPKLVDSLRNLYPGTKHVASIDLDRALDREVWTYAKRNELAIVTKDADFSEMAVLKGFPPKVIWIRRGNCSTSEIEKMLRRNRRAIEKLNRDPETGVLTLY